MLTVGFGGCRIVSHAGITAIGWNAGLGCFAQNGAQPL
jgi:hypothetical protein